MELKFEDGTQQAVMRWDGLARIPRWCESVSALGKQFSNGSVLNWGSVRVISLCVYATTDTLADSGTVSFKPLRAASTGSWARSISLETLQSSSTRGRVKHGAIAAIVSR